MKNSPPAMEYRHVMTVLYIWMWFHFGKEQKSDMHRGTGEPWTRTSMKKLDTREIYHTIGSHIYEASRVGKCIEPEFRHGSAQALGRGSDDPEDTGFPFGWYYFETRQWWWLHNTVNGLQGRETLYFSVIWTLPHFFKWEKGRHLDL